MLEPPKPSKWSAFQYEDFYEYENYRKGILPAHTAMEAYPYYYIFCNAYLHPDVLLYQPFGGDWYGVFEKLRDSGVPSEFRRAYYP